MIKRINANNGVYSNDIKNLSRLTNYFNKYSVTLSKHAKERLDNRIMKTDIFQFLENTKLEIKNIFEYYKVNDRITKVLYRVPFNEKMDISLAIAENRLLCTVWLNKKRKGE